MKKLLASLGIGSTLVLGGVDAAKLKETPIDIVETIASERVEAKQVGNEVQTTFPWKGEAGIKVIYDMGEPTLEEKFADKRKKQVITETVTDFEGGFKVDIILSEKPDTNVFCYAIEGAESYDFFYQAPLTPEEIAEGSSRPPEIEGSYAVYHKTLANHRIGGQNYATGKVMHIPRPQVWEIGNEEATTVWADLSYDEGQLCVTVPQDYLDKADYSNGVRVDPTFGYTSSGASSAIFSNAGSALGSVSNTYTANTGDTITSYTIVCNKVSADSNVSISAYSVSGGLPSTRLATPVTILINSTTKQSWTTTTINQPLTSGTTYGVSFGDIDTASTPNGIRAYFDSTSGVMRSYNTDYTLPATWTSISTSAANYSIYATYTASAGGVATPPRLQLNSGRMQINSQLKVQP